MFDHSFSFDCQDKVILVVEDDYDIGDIIENYLKREGMSVIRAMNGKQAIELHASQPIDLILLDIKLPELNGWEVLNKISVHDKFHRTLILSGFCLLKIAKISL
ncbi:response regulator, partial [Acinetobacter baumannii]